MGVTYYLTVLGLEVQVSWTPAYEGVYNREPVDCAPSEPEELDIITETPYAYRNHEIQWENLVWDALRNQQLRDAEL